MDLYDEIAAALDRASPATPALIERHYGGVLAVDQWREWAAVFYLKVAANGNWSSDVYLQQLDGTGAWQPIGGGGMSGSDWPLHGWKPALGDIELSVGQSQGLTVEDPSGEEIDLVARTGYAGPSVWAVDVNTDGTSRILRMEPAIRAFVVLGPRGIWNLSPLDEQGGRLSEAQVIDCR